MRKKFVIERNPTALDQLADVVTWMHSRFEAEHAGGRFVGTRDASTILDDRRMTGCHDYAVLFSAIATALGYEAGLVEGTGIAWSRDVAKASGAPSEFVGHVFVEVTVEGRTLLVDPTNRQYTDRYDPANPVILAPRAGDAVGFYRIGRGKTMREYGVKSLEDLTRIQVDMASVAAAADLTKPGASEFRRF